jgi:hypothetical protein
VLRTWDFRGELRDDLLDVGNVALAANGFMGRGG